MEKINKKESLFKKYLPVIAAFVIPVVVLGVMFVFREIYPFGNNMYMRSDSYHQYLTFLKEFQSILKNGDSLMFTWNIGLGSDFPSTYAYYLATPIYWIVGILPDTILPEIIQSLIILKAGLMSAFFAYYMQSRSGKRSMVTALLGIFYAMSSYMCAYSWNNMWLDCLVLLPLILLGLERLVKRKRIILYTVTLAISILSNYYISIMIAIYLIFYFLYLVFCEPGKRGFGHKVRSLGRFAYSSVLAGLMACITVVPALVNLFNTASAGGSFPKTLKAYFNFLEMVSHSVMNMEVTMLKGYIPNIYCTIAVFMLIPLYFLGRKITTKEKIGKALLMGIMLATFSLNIPTYIWHGFHYPNSLSSRESFIYIFLLLTMCGEALLEIEEYDWKEIAGCFIAGAAALFGLQVLYDSETYTILFILLSVLFLALWFVWTMFAKFKKLPRVILVLALMAIVVSEAAINTDATGYSTISRTTYMKDNEAIKTLLDGIDDDGFYRVEKTERRTKNDGAWLNYRSASEFSSTVLDGVEKFYKAFGFQASTNAFAYYGHTPLSAAILGVKYEISPEQIEDDPLVTCVGEEDGFYLYENKYSLPLAFLVNTSTQAKTDMNDKNPFAVQNDFVHEATGEKAIFTKGMEDTGKNPEYIVTNDGRVFIYIADKLDGVKATVTRNDEIISEKKYTSVEHGRIIDIGDLKKHDKVVFESTDEDVETFRIRPAVMDYEKLDKAMQALGSSGLELEVFEDTYVKGTMNAEEDGLVFTTIPDNGGWSVYVDGREVKSWAFHKAFVSFNIEEGEHVIEFRYSSPGFFIGALLTVFAALLFVSICILRKRKKTLKNA